MTPKNEPAFPRHPGYNEGMTLRDYFAARASDRDVDEHRSGYLSDRDTSPIYRTREQAKYAYADAMLAARALANHGDVARPGDDAKPKEKTL